MKNLFGTDGMRGAAGEFPLDAPTVRIVGSSLARHLQTALSRPAVIVLGRDTRESGPWLERALIEGAAASGAECHSAGVITTPGVAYLTRTLPADAGVVISASHNPFHDNGIKIFAPTGRKMDDATERKIEADIFAALPVPENKIGEAAIKNDADYLCARYLDFLARDIGDELSLADLRIVVDCANGAASALAPRLLESLGAQVIAMNNHPDGRNINRDSGSLHVAGLRENVLSERADLGIAFDGDADRALFIDAAGNYVDGDATLWVLANYFQARGELSNSTVVATVMSNIGLELALRSRGLNLVRTDVGDKYVLDELLRSGASLGGEQSGHVIIPSLSLAGDGLITTLCLLRAIQQSAKSLQELTAVFQRYPQVLVNVRVKEKRPFAELPAVQEVAAEIEANLADQGRLLLRYSGTEPLARIMIEGPDQSQIERYANRLAEVIRVTSGASERSPE
ncbi:MAG TPA: phosphoglucosamine mutase [Pyrinomonadaceae bacterium]|nr:phosphoglucosamine mutase [Pyrinomonadaceae bacterium]